MRYLVAGIIGACLFYLLEHDLLSVIVGPQDMHDRQLSLPTHRPMAEVVRISDYR